MPATPQPRPTILSIEPYVGGESKLPGVNRIFKLSSNEGAFGPPPGARAAMAEAAAEMHRYPDGGAAALREAIGQAFPEVAKFELIDYKVRILDQGHGTDAITRVLIETSDGVSSWVTVGVGANVIEASWEALLDGVTFGLRRHGV